jgi:hypothetical protein
VTDTLKGIRELAIQKPHVVLQFQELLVKLGLLEHGRVSRENGRLKVKLQPQCEFLQGQKAVPANFLTAKLKHEIVFTVL